MKIKHSIKKVGAVAGSALMVGLTMGSAATLADFPQPFVEDDGTVASQVVVGTGANVADVVGAVNVAAALGQSAVQTETKTVPGESADVDGEQYETAVRDSVDGNWLDKSTYSALARRTVEDQNGDDVRVLERIQADFGTVVGNQSNVLTTVAEDAVQYEVSYSPGFTIGDSISVLGNDYEVTAITQDSEGNAQLELGSKMVEEGLSLDDSYEHGPYTITVIDKDEDGGKIYLSVEKDGSTLNSFGLDTGETKTVDNGALEITADEVFFGSRSDYIDVTSIYTDTTVTATEDSPFDADYTVSSLSGSGYNATTHAGTVTGLTLQNDLLTTSQDPAETDNEDDISRLAAGDVFAGPADYFALTAQGLTEESLDDVTVKENHMVSFTDTLGISQSLDASKADYAFDGTANLTRGDGDYYVDVNDRPFKISFSGVPSALGGDGSAASIDVTASYEGFEQTGTATFSGIAADSSETATAVIDADSGYGAYVEVDVTVADTDSDAAANVDTVRVDVTDSDGSTDNTDLSLNTEYDNTLTWTGTELDVAEVDSETDSTVSTVNVTWDGSGAINGASDDAAGEWALSGENEETLSRMGSQVQTADGLSSVSLSIPENQRLFQHAFGSTETTSGSDQTYEAVVGQGTLPDMARLDTEVTESVRSNNHLILVGGPAVNTLVDDLGDAVDLSEVADAQSGAVLQVVNDAFTSGQHALVVAGYSADDTRSAARYLSNYADHEQALADAGEQLVLTEADYPSSQ